MPFDTRLAVCLLRQEALQRLELLFVGLDPVEVALDHRLDQGPHLGQEAAGGFGVEGFEGRTQRRNPVDETAHRVAAGREERRVAQRGAQHGQLQPRDLARHLRRHLGVGQDLFEQGADDVDHHVVQRPRGRLPQLVAVGADQVGQRRAPGLRRHPRMAGLVVAGSVVDISQPSHQLHQRRVDTAYRCAAPQASQVRGLGRCVVAARRPPAAEGGVVAAAGMARCAGVADPRTDAVASARLSGRVAAASDPVGRQAHTQAQWLHARLAQVGHDVGITNAQQPSQGAPHLGGQQLAHFQAF